MIGILSITLFCIAFFYLVPTWLCFVSFVETGKQKSKYDYIIAFCPIINILYIVKAIIYLIIKGLKSLKKLNLKDFIKEFFK